MTSHLKIPFCGPAQGAPFFSNKREYSHFFRMQPGNGLGIHLVRLLRYMKVTRVGIRVAAAGALFKSMNEEAIATLRANNIIVAFSLAIPDSSFASKNFNQTFTTIRNQRVNYIISLMLPNDINALYFEAARAGLVGANYIWLGIIWPTITSTIQRENGRSLKQRDSYNLCL
ncbi:periplasmic binding protein-like I [Chytridium lagenaria]|nr:periplasmic binding protein-like I [Chytridium lagenaria]